MVGVPASALARFTLVAAILRLGTRIVRAGPFSSKEDLDLAVIGGLAPALQLDDQRDAGVELGFYLLAGSSP